MKYTTSNQILEYIAKVGFAGLYNVSHYKNPTRAVKYKNEKDEIKGYQNSTIRQMKRLLKEELIKPIPNTNKLYKDWKYRFYTLTEKGIKTLELSGYKRIERKSIDLIRHEHAKIDIATQFLLTYPDYKIDIQYPSGKEAIGNYKPDIIVKMEKDGKKFDFIVEFERTRKQEAIITDKIKKNLNKLELAKRGLSEHTKVLFVVTVEEWDTFLRPFQIPRQQDLIRAENVFLNGLLSKVEKMNLHRYRFTCLHQAFKDFNKVLDTNGNVRTLL